MWRGAGRREVEEEEKEEQEKQEEEKEEIVVVVIVGGPQDASTHGRKQKGSSLKRKEGKQICDR